MNGLLVIDKAAGMTSHDVVAMCRRILGERRVGHAGTLDPSATGVLVLGIGRATRLLRFVEDSDKGYVATAAFGITTSTLDAEGEVVAENDTSLLTEEDVRSAMKAFVGDIEQVPPMVSAVKVGGEPLYRKARRGEDVERAPRRVRVHELGLDSFEPGPRARATLRVRCARGTYVRSLVADIGDALAVGASVATLRRTRVGAFTETDAIPISEVTPEALRPMETAVAGYPRRSVDEAGARALVHGKPLAPGGIDGVYAVYGPDGLLAMAEDREGEARSLCVLTQG
ncbi:MAG: tRNA pseudouridine(55) synthase TruB [Actinobacteria bacterium]|nr:MAG: tRNA pseudouridine(55) synthase TruB [Actinomycetota bacterium]